MDYDTVSEPWVSRSQCCAHSCIHGSPPCQTSAARLLGEVCIDLRSLRPDRLSDRWYPLRYSAGAPYRPAGSLRLRVLRTADARSVCLDAARGLLECAEAETRALLVRVQSRIAELGGGAPSAAALTPAIAANAPAALSGGAKPGSQPALASGVGPALDVLSRVRAERAAAAADGRRVVGMQLEVSVVEARGLSVQQGASREGQEAGVAEVYVTLRAGHVTR